MLLGVRSVSFQIRVRQHRLRDACSGPLFLKTTLRCFSYKIICTLMLALRVTQVTQCSFKIDEKVS